MTDPRFIHVGEHFTTPLLRNCARCTGDHRDMEWRPLTRPIEDSNGTRWNHWAPCPTNGEPILMKATDKGGRP